MLKLFIQGTACGSSGVLDFFTFALKCFLWLLIAVLANPFLFASVNLKMGLQSAHTG